MQHRLLCVSFVSLAALAAMASAQGASPSDQPLKGPKVQDETVPGESRRFSSGAQGRKDSVGGNIPHKTFMKAIDSLRGDQADSAVRLAKDQIAKLEEIEVELKAAQRSYMQEHRAEIMKARRDADPAVRRRIDTLLSQLQGTKRSKIGEGDADAMEPAAKDQTSKDSGDAMQDEKMTDQGESGAAKANREMLKQLFEGAPKAEDYHGKMWAILTEAQREAVQKEIAKSKAELEAKKTPKKAALKNKGEADADLDLSALPAKVRERLRNMTPEQREEAIRRFLEREGK